MEDKKLFKVLVDVKIGDTEHVAGDNVELSDEEAKALPEGTVEVVEGGVNGTGSDNGENAAE